MLRSMTGFGRGETAAKNGKIQVEIRTVNHRFFEVSSRLPENFQILQKVIIWLSGDGHWS